MSSPDRPTLYLTTGLPASGKSTWAVAQVANAPGRAVRVNRDLIRRSLFGAVTVPRGTGHVLDEAQLDLVESNLATGRDVYVDDTNLVAARSDKFAALAFELGAHFEVVDFTGVSAAECRRRNALRSGEELVPAAAMDSFEQMLKREGPYRNPGYGLPKPAPAAEPGLASAVLLDLDGTAAIIGDRSAYDVKHVERDLPNVPVLQAAAALKAAGHRIIGMSGRKEAARVPTLRWAERVGLSLDALHMRADSDQRRDSFVKHDLFWQHVAGQVNVLLVLDDRDQVVRLWRTIGLPCFQVAPGAF